MRMVGTATAAETAEMTAHLGDDSNMVAAVAAAAAAAGAVVEADIVGL